jgi:hypothetical protein
MTVMRTWGECADSVSGSGGSVCESVSAGLVCLRSHQLVCACVWLVMHACAVIGFAL